MDPTGGYAPDADYSSAYNALRARIAASYAGQRGALNSDLTSRGVQTSGVSAIPTATMLASQAGAEAGGAQNFALEQARTAVREKEAATQFGYDQQLAQQGFTNNSTLARRMGQNQLAGQIGAGVIGAVGSYYGGPVGGQMGAKARKKLGDGVSNDGSDNGGAVGADGGSF